MSGLFFFNKKDLEYKSSFPEHFFRIAKFSRRFAVLRLCCMYHYAVYCF